MSTAAPVTEVVVCTTCRPAGTSRESPPAGLALFEAVVALQQDGRAAGVRVSGVACMSGCSRSCTVAMQAPGKPSYYFGDLAADAETAAQVLACAQLHARSVDGALPRDARPERLRSGILARLPACASAPDAPPVAG